MKSSERILTHDDWREETQSRLRVSALYKQLLSRADQEAPVRAAVALVDEAVHYAYQRTKTIVRHMGQYTLHDGDHLFRVLNLVERLMPSGYLARLSASEAMLTILAVFFHDIGMAPSESDVLSWKKAFDSTPLFDSKNDENQCLTFKRFISTKSELIEERESAIAAGNSSNADAIAEQLVAEFIRHTHADRSRQILKQDWERRIVYRDADLTVDLATICFSHNEDPLSLLELDLQRMTGPGEFACLRAVAMFLRLADLLDFDGKRTPRVLFSHLNVRTPVSLIEWQKHRAVEAWEISPENIRFHATCAHPAIESAIHSFCDVIDRELTGCNNVLKSINEGSYNISASDRVSLPFKVDRTRIQTQRDIEGNPLYTYRETQFNLSKRQVIDLLMGTKLYGDPEVALRELLQNSIDACLLRQALEQSWNGSYKPEITVSFSSDDGEDYLVVDDNGTGMDQHIIDNYYSKVGSSFYKSSDFFAQRADANAKFEPTSRFGIGILSCFMVSDSISVQTRRITGHHDAGEPLHVLIEGQDSIFWIRPGARKKPGTTTKLLLRKDNHPWKDMDAREFLESVGNLIPNPPFKVTIRSDKEEVVADESTFQTIDASSLARGDWEKHENIKTVSLRFSEPAIGFSGSALVALLEKKRKPVQRLELKSNSVSIDGQSYDLERSMTLSGRSIDMSSTSITIDDDGDVTPDSSSSELVRSASRVSFHGIEVPMDLFPHYWRKQKNQVTLRWPMPMLLVIDIAASTGIELNSSRSQIIQSPEWDSFEAILAEQVLLGIQSKVSVSYWTALLEIFLSADTSEPFRSACMKLSSAPRTKKTVRTKSKSARLAVLDDLAAEGQKLKLGY